MKRNLSSQAIKAMAIGMAIALGSSAAISGVVDGTVVEAFAEDEGMAANITNPASKFENIDNDSYIVTPEGLLFKVSTPGAKTGENGKSNDDGEVTLVGTVTTALGSAENATDGHNVPFKGNIENNRVSIKTSDYVADSNGSEIKFKIKQIGDETNPLAVATLSNSSKPDFAGYATPSTIDGSKIGGDSGVELASSPEVKANAFKGVTVNGDLDLSKATIDATAFTSDSKGVTVNGTLTLPKTAKTAGLLKDSTIDTLVLEEGHPGNKKLLDGANIKNIDLSKNTASLDIDTFEGATIENVIANDKASFNGATIKNLKTDPNKVPKNAFNGVKFVEGGNINIISKIILNCGFGGNNNSINVDLSKSTVNVESVETLEDGAFFKANLPEQMLFTNVTEVKDDAFTEIANENVTLKFPSLTDIKNIGEKAFGDTEEGAKITLVLPFGTDTTALKDKLVNKNVTIIEENAVVTNSSGTYTFEKGTNDDEVTLIDYSTVDGISTFSVESSFTDGKLSYGSKEYTLTKIGNGKALTSIDNNALEGHTGNVKEISDNAFKDNQSITKANFPEVTKVGENAFANTNVVSVDLGSKVNGKVVVSSNAFDKVSTLKNVATNAESKDVVKTAVEKSSSKDIKVSSGGKEETVKPSDNNSGGSGGSGSGGSGGSGSGGSGSSGGGANIGKNNDDTEEATTDNNNNNSNSSQTVTQDKVLSFDAISLPSVEGEAKVFGDVSANHWAKSYIDKLSTAGVINGANGMFNPNGQTKRADVTVMLVNLLGLTPETNAKFLDVNPSAYYAPYVGAASSYGIVNGSNGMFNPEGIISRQDTMVMIAQILKGLNLNVNADASTLNQFSDANSVAGYANENVAILVNSGIISGNNGKLNPTAPVTRAEMATIMSKLYDVLASANN